MNVKGTIFFLIGLLMTFSVKSQDNFDIIRMMHYNLLNYRNTTPQCDGTTNPPATKDAALKTILNHAKPDLVTLNEIGANPINANRLLSNAFVVTGMDYDFANYSNNASSSLVNMLFYNRNRLVLQKQTLIDKALSGQLLVRVIDVYSLYYKDPIGLAAGDTVFFHVAVAHLKAGDTQADKDERARMTEALMAYIQKTKTKPENWIISGDFNIQSSTETSYQNLINHSVTDIRFFDPADASGTWNNNANFAGLHTQSTRTSSTSGGCFSSSGLDDRFDFILANKEIMDNALHLGYIKNSYKALGQDGSRFNSTINSPANSSVPAEVVTALYNLSDHLPVSMDMKVRKWVLGMKNPVENPFFRVQSPADQSLNLYFNQHVLQPPMVKIFDISGKCLLEMQLPASASKAVNMDISSLKDGLYYLQLSLDGNSLGIQKFIKLPGESR